MAFWAIFSVGLLVSLGFFIWSIRNYATSAYKYVGSTRAKARPTQQGDMNSILIALEAQYLLAPSLALEEARDLARRLNGGSFAARMRRRGSRGDFQAIVARLSEWDAAAIKARTTVTRL